MSVWRKATFCYLHSNLVIFKFDTLSSVSSLLPEFTFQSGDIQIKPIEKEEKEVR